MTKYLDSDGLAHLWEKLKSFFVAQSKIANNATTTESGFVLDARTGKVLADQITDLNAQINSLKTSLANNYYTKSPQNLPSGFNSIDRASMNHLKNGWYWHFNNDGTLNFPNSWGFMIKFGYEIDGDFSALYFTQDKGTIYRCSGNQYGISGWVAI